MRFASLCPRVIVAALALLMPASGRAQVRRAAADLRLVTPEGHGGLVRSAAFSPDGRLVVTASFDNTARLWEVATGREVRRLGGHSDNVNWAAFSPDGRLVATASSDGTARVWDAASGRELQRLVGHSGLLNSIALSADGRLAVTAADDSSARLWDVATGRELRRLAGRDFRMISAAFSPDGRLVASGSNDWSVRLWDAATGRALRELGGHHYDINSVAFSADGRRLVSAAQDSTAIVWDVVTGRQLRRIVGHGGPLSSAAFSPDGKVVVTASWDRTVRLWDAATGRELRRLVGQVETAAFSPDGRLLVTGGSGDLAQLWEAATGRELRRLEGHTIRQRSATSSPDGRLVVALGADSVARLWEVATGRELRRFAVPESYLYCAASSLDGRLLVGAADDATVRVWDVASGREVRRLREMRRQPELGRLSSLVTSIGFSPDGQLVATGSADGTTQLFEVTSGREVRRLEGGDFLGFSLDGGTVVTAFSEKAGEVGMPAPSVVYLWEVGTGRELTRLAGHTGGVGSVALSPDGRLVVTVSADSSARLWDAATGRELRRLAGYSDAWGQAAFSPDGRLVVTLARDGPARVWDAATGQEVRQPAGDGDRIYPAALSPDGRHFFMHDGHSTVLRDARTGAELFRRFTLDSADWVVVAPDGRFDGTERGTRSLHYARGVETVRLEAFFDKFYTPGLTGLQLAGAPYDGPDIRRGVLTPPSLRIASPASGETRDRTVTVLVDAVDRGGGVEDVRLYHNGSRVGGGERGLGVPGRASCPVTRGACFTVELLPGPNTLEATAFASDGTEAERARVTLTVTGATPTATLHVLAVGINAYRNPRYNLNYGRADAAAFADSLRRGGGKIFADIRVDTLFDTAATRANIAAGFARVAARAQPQDVFVFYFAGHGTAEKVNDTTRFFLVPADVTQLSDSAQLTRSGVSADQLRALLDAVPARKKLMVVDACRSGEMLASFARRGAAEERAIAQLARSSGVFVMSSTDSEQFASEVATLGHGVLTYALLAALGADSSGRSRERMVREVMSRAERMVPELSARHRGRPQYPMVWSNGMDFPLVVR